MCLVGAVGRGQIFQLIHDAPGLGFNPAVMQSRNVGFGCPFSDRSAASFHTAFGHSQVSFTITEKTTTAIVGPSGAGSLGLFGFSFTLVRLPLSAGQNSHR